MPMSMLKYINKNKALPFGLDFAKSREDAIELAQLLCGDNWTDYNDHDPGVTIIEQFCYALAELSYQAETSAEDIFFRGQGKLDEQQLKERYFLLKPPGHEFAVKPNSELEDLSPYLPIRNTFPANYGLNEIKDSEADATEDERRLNNYLALFDALLVDFHVRLSEFPGLLAQEAIRQGNPAARFAQLFLRSASGVVSESLKDTYESAAFGREKEIALKKYQLERYGEFYDEDYEQLLAELWGLNEPKDHEKLQEVWLDVLNELIASYGKYAGAKRMDIFDQERTENEYGIVTKLKILLQPILSNGMIELAVEFSDDRPALATLNIDGLNANYENILNALVEREFPFYLIPNIILSEAQIEEE